MSEASVKVKEAAIEALRAAEHAESNDERGRYALPPAMKVVKAWLSEHADPHPAQAAEPGRGRESFLAESEVIEAIQEAIGDWGGPERSTFEAAMRAVIAELDKLPRRPAGGDEGEHLGHWVPALNEYVPIPDGAHWMATEIEELKYQLTAAQSARDTLAGRVKVLEEALTIAKRNLHEHMIDYHHVTSDDDWAKVLAALAAPAAEGARE